MSIARRRFIRRAAGGLLGTVVAGDSLLATAASRIPDQDGWYEIGARLEPVLGAAAGRDESATSDVAPLELPAVLPAERRVELMNDHTRERLDIVYVTDGSYIDASLEAINHLMRDHREDAEHVMDPRLIDDLFRLHSSLDTSEPMHILSGYRTPQTNAKLRRRSSGVAKFSLHMEGKAADIYVPGIKTRALQQAALALNSGGVGYYRESGFVHLDTGLKRRWGS